MLRELAAELSIPPRRRGRPSDAARRLLVLDLAIEFQRDGLEPTAEEGGPFVITLRRIFRRSRIKDMPKVAREFLPLSLDAEIVMVPRGKKYLSADRN